jgi:uncharacterized membrane protein
MQVRASKETGRLEAFSDGIFAIAITLLILTIPVPAENRNIPAFILHQGPSFLAYVVSFMTILIMWANHHSIFNLVARADRLLLIINGILLMLITFLNYPTAIVAAALRDQHYTEFAALFYTGTLIAISIIYNICWRYIVYRRQLLDEQVDPQIIKKISNEYRFGPLYYAIAFIFSGINAYAGLIIALLLALYFGLTAQNNPERLHDMKRSMPGKL